MKKQKRYYIEINGDLIQAVITCISATQDEYGLTEHDEEEIKRLGGFKSKSEAEEFLIKEYNICAADIYIDE